MRCRRAGTLTIDIENVIANETLAATFLGALPGPTRAFE
jgi:hypothetical protein